MKKEFMMKLLAIRKAEREITKNMQEFGFEGQIYLNEMTAKLAEKDPKLLKKIDDLLDKLDKDKK